MINQEIQKLKSLSHDSILKDWYEAVKHFSWETVWVELTTNVPTLMKILSALVPNPDDNKPTLCLVVSMLLKKRVAQMGLVFLWQCNKQAGNPLISNEV